MFYSVHRVFWAFVIWLFACTSIVHATTITVMQDGTGDFELIQPALDAAASGDTILIGPGEFLVSNSTELPGYAWEVDVYAFVPVDELTIVGSGKTETYIGPTSYQGNWETFSPICIGWLGGLNLRISGLTIRNCFDGLQAGGGQVFFDDCNISDNSYGVFWSTEGNGGRITNCNIVSNVPGGPNGLYLTGSGSGILVEDCLFDGTKVSIKNLESISILRCEIQNMVVGLQVENGTHCIIDDCLIFNCTNVGVSVWDNSTICEIQNSEISGGGLAARIHNYSVLQATDTIFNGGYWGVIEFSNSNDSFVTNCHLSHGDGPLIRSSRHPSNGVVVHDLRNNFWGITDGDEIRSLILDGIDDPDNASTVLFEPFVGGPVPTERTTLDGLKALFR